MKTYTIKITKQAYRQLCDIKNYIANELLAPEAAYNTIDAIKQKIKSLSTMPSRIKLTEEEPWHTEGIHRMRVRNYYVYFWIDEENSKVQITAVIYVSRDQKTQLKLMDTE